MKLVITLQVVDNYWMEQINTMSHLREGIYLRGYGQEDPLRAYTIEGFNLFDKMLQAIDKDVSVFLLKAEIRQNIERKENTETMTTNDSEAEPVKRKPKRVKKIGRNDPCPCGTNNVVESSKSPVITGFFHAPNTSEYTLDTFLNTFR